jgi:hypothetical protein
MKQGVGSTKKKASKKEERGIQLSEKDKVLIELLLDGLKTKSMYDPEGLFPVSLFSLMGNTA